jgi:hydrogenase/urease accessory protein HupE
MTRASVGASVAAALLAAPGVAQAHLVNSGLGSFYDGSLHLLLSPGDLLGLVAVALLAGLRGARAGRLTVMALTLSWLAAGLVGLTMPVSPDLNWVSFLSFVILGALVAADARLSPVTVAWIAGLYGTLHGFLNGSALAALGAGSSSLLGIVLTVLLLALFSAASVVPVRALWSRVAVRVAGSWIVAVGILMLGWLAKGSA